MICFRCICILLRLCTCATTSFTINWFYLSVLHFFRCRNMQLLSSLTSESAFRLIIKIFSFLPRWVCCWSRRWCPSSRLLGGEWMKTLPKFWLVFRSYSLQTSTRWCGSWFTTFGVWKVSETNELHRPWCFSTGTNGPDVLLCVAVCYISAMTLSTLVNLAMLMRSMVLHR